MADICVVSLSDDDAIVERLVVLLRKRWDVWWAHDITHGGWEQAVRSEIARALVLVPVLSGNAIGERMNIVADEMRFAQSRQIATIPFLIGLAEMPFGFGGLNYVDAKGWVGEDDHQGYLQLLAKLDATIKKTRNEAGAVGRKQELEIRNKILHLPAFVFSLSSHETQVRPRDGATLLRLLRPEAALVSAYDARNSKPLRGTNSSFRLLCQSEAVLFLDSGNYEAYRKRDRYSPRGNPDGWHRDQFRQVARTLSPDLAFSFDRIQPAGKPKRIAQDIVSAFLSDDRSLRSRSFPLCPIIHLPSLEIGSIGDVASEIITSVATALQPIMLAIPERELGNGLRERARTVREIRSSLNALGKYYPLHLLGTGNPLSMIAFAAAGADSFDGLEWCRTVADNSTGFLFHFQQYECFGRTGLHRVRDESTRLLMEDPEVPYSMKALSFNVDFFKDWTRTFREMIHAGQVETLLRMVPGIGPELFGDLYP